ncbi:MAG TPA: CBS domain-containing protein [Candidatus Deferrimicrobium sp.]|nr:CBS domain-containing protein [Candidatus Deferrimicrobium sp.]
MNVEEIMQKDVVYAEVPGNRKEVIQLMQNYNVKAMPVVKKGTKEIVGIISQTDLLLNPDEEQIALLMTRDPVQISPQISVKELVDIMIQKNLRRLPVTENNQVVGMISIGDIIKAISRMNIKTPIKDLIKTKINVIWDGTPLNAVPAIMRLGKIRTLPCIDENEALTGIISDVDFIRESKIISEEKASSISSSSDKEWSWETSDILLITKKKLKMPNRPVRDVMVKNIITINEFTSISECANKMWKNKIDQIPVLDARGELIGLIDDVTIVTTVQNKN